MNKDIHLIFETYKQSRKIDPAGPGSTEEQQAEMLNSEEEREIYINSGCDMETVMRHRLQPGRQITITGKGDFCIDYIDGGKVGLRELDVDKISQMNLDDLVYIALQGRVTFSSIKGFK